MITMTTIPKKYLSPSYLPSFPKKSLLSISLFSISHTLLTSSHQLILKKKKRFLYSTTCMWNLIWKPKLAFLRRLGFLFAILSLLFVYISSDKNMSLLFHLLLSLNRRSFETRPSLTQISFSADTLKDLQTRHERRIPFLLLTTFIKQILYLFLYLRLPN